MIGQAKQIHQSCRLAGRSVMNNLSGMTDVLDVWFRGNTAVTESCHDAEVAEGQRSTMKDEQELHTGCFLSAVPFIISPPSPLWSLEPTATLAAL